MRSCFFFLALLGSHLTAWAVTAPSSVEQWDVYEIELEGPSDGNPFAEVRLTGTFSDGEQSTEVAGFYDGDGVYRIRFMPPKPGNWTFQTRSNRTDLTNQQGAFEVTPAQGDNHGPIHVAYTYHFAYADGTPYKPIGTTSYSWTHRTEEMQERTLKTLAEAPFNKLRMGVFPQAHGADYMPPTRFPFAGEPHNWDFERPNPEFFQHLEQRIGQLRDMGIVCDLILFYPYGEGRWGLDRLEKPEDEQFLRYLVARLAAYRNIWWSIGNEYDFFRTKTMEDWDRYFQVVMAADPYGHPRSIHNGFVLYDNNKPWVTHASIQNGAAVEHSRSAQLYRDVWRKPIVYDEVKYEGDHDKRWAQLSGEELVHRFWSGTVAGTYVGHSEYFQAPHDIVWLGQGGELKGTSPERITFLRQILEDSPKEGINPADKWQDSRIGGKAGEYYLVYFGKETPTEWAFQLPKNGLTDGMEFQVEVIDTWGMTIKPVDKPFVTKKNGMYSYVAEGNRKVKLPGKEHMALRIRYVGGAESPGANLAPLEP
ncbi:MAG: DUF5060 domain-containing protein [Verrucomicrobiota bacterium JB022]|nr:DUF5060 domain-containing protein [Verrucomicrobiota bacterium JB022]